MKNVISGVGSTFNPLRGQGMTESIIAIMIVAVVLYSAINQIDLPVYVSASFGMILGWLFKGNEKNESRRKGDKDESNR